ncbi:MAG: site-specific integrase, partial [Clostridium sp.]|nr:site-specific integrase [Clostridium sp.]
ASKHRSLLSRLSEFRSLNTRFDEIDLAFLRDFELFLRKEGNVNNSIATKFAIFKAAYNKALAEGLFLQKINPFAKYKVGSLWTRTRKRAITKEDIQKLVALEIAPNYRTDYAEFARDIFLFSYYTAGINFTDIATLRAVLSTRPERHADYREIQQGQPRTRRLYLPYSRPHGTQDSTTDFQPHTQGSAESQSGVKDAG